MGKYHFYRKMWNSIILNDTHYNFITFQLYVLLQDILRGLVIFIKLRKEQTDHMMFDGLDTRRAQHNHGGELTLWW